MPLETLFEEMRPGTSPVEGCTVRFACESMVVRGRGQKWEGARRVTGHQMERLGVSQRAGTKQGQICLYSCYKSTETLRDALTAFKKRGIDSSSVVSKWRSKYLREPTSKRKRERDAAKMNDCRHSPRQETSQQHTQEGRVRTATHKQDSLGTRRR